MQAFENKACTDFLFFFLGGIHMATKAYLENYNQNYDKQGRMFSKHDLYLKYHLSTCERQDMAGLSHHTLDIFRKEG